MNCYAGPSKAVLRRPVESGLAASAAHQALLAEHGVVGSMSPKGNCCNNAVMKRFFLNLKMECVWQHVWQRVWQRDCANHAEATSDITDCIGNFHNSVRLHSSLGNLPPNSFAHQSLIEQPYRLARNYSIRTVSGKSAGGNDASPAGTGAWARLWPGQLLPGLGRSRKNQQRATAK